VVRAFVAVGLPAELPKFQYSGRLGDMTSRRRDSDNVVDGDGSISVSAVAESLIHSEANDSSMMLDTDMDEI